MIRTHIKMKMETVAVEPEIDYKTAPNSQRGKRQATLLLFVLAVGAIIVIMMTSSWLTR